MLNGLDLFSGIGGITLALKDYVRPIAYCEIEPYAQSVLKSRIADGLLPDAPIWDDVRKLDGYPFRGVVDIIYGGFPCQDLSVAGLGKGIQAERSGLFFEIMRLAEEIKPKFIFLENVPAITGRGLNLVLKEIASLRYDSRYGVLSAYDVGAPHQRDRWFLLAYSPSLRRREGSGEKTSEKRQSIINAKPCDDCSARSIRNTLADSSRERIQRLRPCGEQVTNPHGEEGLPLCESKRPFITNWQTEPDVGRVADGIPARVDRIKCLGNAVVPAQVREAFKRLIGID